MGEEELNGDIFLIEVSIRAARKCVLNMFLITRNSQHLERYLVIIGDIFR